MNLIAWAIVISEVAFWILILLGLVARYLFKRKKLGLLLLALTPIIDGILLVTTSMDMYRGATATTFHALAAVYIAVSLLFGKRLILWADERFRYYVTKQGEAPVKRYGIDYAKHYLNGWLRHIVAYGIGVGLLIGLTILVDDPSRTEALSGVIKVWSIVVVIDLLITVTYFIWPKQAKQSAKLL